MTTVHLEEFPGLALGKTEARPEAVSLKLRDYTPDVPTPPTAYGHYGQVPDFPMFANDQYGCCVWAGAGHETQIFVAEGHGTVAFTDELILAPYTAVTGFDPADPSTDQGTDMMLAADYRRKTGLFDIDGKRHVIGAYVGLEAGNDAEVETAAWLFGAVGIGWQLPKYAMLQFQDGKPWTVSRSNTAILGGHYVPIVGADADWLYGITWGKVIPIDRKFLKKNMDEGIASVSIEILWGGKSPEGFSSNQLLADLRDIDGPGTRTPRPTETFSRTTHPLRPPVGLHAQAVNPTLPRTQE